ncbi:MAG: hypothetical protein IJP66_01800, partial [Kiritimatiellae bacterium]|nr:hypothetical protein [Kiritimatiellia bacterium]
MNLAGVSADTSATMTAKAYFGEGPFGTANGVAYQIAGSKSAAPTFLSLGITSNSKVRGGKAYALTAASAGDWPGVIGASGDGVFFGSDDNYAVFRVKNCGTKAREFRFTMERSASGEEPPPLSRRLPRADAIGDPAYTNVEENVAWDISLDAGEILEQIFSIDRAALDAGMEYGAILKIEDRGGSMMRVRLPISVTVAGGNAVAYPAGLWVGEIALTRVSGIDDETPTPVEAGGT